MLAKEVNTMPFSAQRFGVNKRFASEIFFATLAVLLASGVLWSPPGHAAAPLMKTQAPGFYRMMLGDFEITTLSDGVVPLPVKLNGVTAEEIRNRLAEMYLTDPFEMSFNSFLVNTGNKLVLIDAGSGALWGPKAGHLLANLRAAGYRPEQVDEIYITHTHTDHVGGLILGSQRAFPNAMLRAAKSEVDVYLDPEKTAAVIAAATNKDQAKAGLQSMRDLFEPYVKAGKFQSFDEDITLVPGVRAVATHGHTPGHTSYVVESGGQKLIVLGDLVHVGAVQFANPQAQAISDADPNTATAQRARIFDLAADQGYWLAGAHLAFPGIGHLRAGQGRYVWIPANYTIPY